MGLFAGGEPSTAVENSSVTVQDDGLQQSVVADVLGEGGEVVLVERRKEGGGGVRFYVVLLWRCDQAWQGWVWCRCLRVYRGLSGRFGVPGACSSGGVLVHAGVGVEQGSFVRVQKMLNDE